MDRAKLKAKLFKHHLPMMFVFVILFAMIFPSVGTAVATPRVNGYKVVSTINTWMIFLISGLTLQTDEIKAALKAWQGFAYAFVTILFTTPMIGFILINLPVSQPEFAVGLALFACTPTTISAGIQMVDVSRGNVAFALLLTVTTNIIGSATVPIILAAVVSSANVDMDTVSMIINLLVTVLAPMAVGKALRDLVPPVKRFCTRRRRWLSLLSSTNLVCIIWQTISTSQKEIVDAGIVHILATLGWGLVEVLLLNLLNGACMMGLSRLPAPENTGDAIEESSKLAPKRRNTLKIKVDEEEGTCPPPEDELGLNPPSVVGRARAAQPPSKAPTVELTTPPKGCFLVWLFPAMSPSKFAAQHKGRSPLIQPRELKTLLIMPAQKAMPIAATIISFLEGTNKGVVTVGALAPYICQLVWSALLANYMATNIPNSPDDEAWGQANKRPASKLIVSTAPAVEDSSQGSETDDDDKSSEGLDSPPPPDL